MDSENNIYEHALNNVNFAISSKGVMLFIFSLLEVNTDDVRFYVSDREGENKNEKRLVLVPPSDQSVNITLSDEIYSQLKDVKIIKVFEIDWATGQALKTYNAVR